MTGGWDRARTIADAVLYEGYLLYPYRANSAKNQTRWQFGVLGPEGAADAGIGEDDSLSAQVVVEPRTNPTVSVVVRFLQLQHRGVEKDIGGGRFEPAEELSSGSRSWLRWDEAVEREISFGPVDIESDLPQTLPIEVDAGTEIETVDGGRLVRTRRALRAQLKIAAEHDDGFVRLTMTVRNCATRAEDKDQAIAVSLIGTHLVAEVSGVIDRFEFTHALIQETLRTEVPTSQRVRLHRRIARAIEDAAGADVTPHLGALAYHFGEAASSGSVDEAVAYARRAAEHAMTTLAFEDAVVYLDQALTASRLRDDADPVETWFVDDRRRETWRCARDLCA